MRTVVAMVVIALLAASEASGSVRAYAVDPVRADWSGKAHPVLGVSEIITVAFDLLDSTSGGSVELFAGEYGQGGAYNLNISTYPDGTPIAYQNGGTYVRPQHWVRFDRIKMESGKSFTKGKQYEVKFTRSGSDSIQYYYDADNPYPEFGWMKVGPADEYGLALCARVYGVMEPCPPEDFGFCLGWPGDSLELVAGKAHAAGVRADRFAFGWHWMEPTQGNFVWPTAEFEWSHNTVGCEELGLLVGCPKWASTRIDSVWVWNDTAHESGYWSYDTCVVCPPRNLFCPVDSDSNYWARYV